MYNEIVISGTGMLTPLGLNAKQTSTSVRAGLSSFEESSLVDKNCQPYILSSLPDELLLELSWDFEFDQNITSRELRILQMSISPLIEVFGNLPHDHQEIPLLLGLPRDLMGESDYGSNLIAMLDSIFPNKFDISQSITMCKGRASGLIAIHEACMVLENNDTDIIIVGAVDSYKDSNRLIALDMENRINSEETMDGFTPGEGAAFLLITKSETAEKNGMEKKCKLVSSSVGFESGHLYSEEPYKGEGLANTFETLFSSNGNSLSKVATVFSSMNGENHFAKEWGVAYLRNQMFIEEEYSFEHPADCFGDTGAACGPLMMGIATDGILSSNMIKPVLVYTSSDSGERAACIIE
jgi:3-oxoacyl-[acyl-carrier-protein] synthase I